MMEHMGYKKVELYQLDSPVAEPNVSISSKRYQIERSEANGKIVWHGVNKNWIKDANAEKWQETGVEVTKKCEEPEYETMRKKLEINLRKN